MKLRFTGIGAAYYPILGSNCAFFEHEDHLFLIDCGESTFKTMFAREEIFRNERIMVLLTHLHADHIGSLGSFLSFCKNVLHKKVLLVALEDTVVRILSMCGVAPDQYDFTTDISQCNMNGLTIMPHIQSHVNDMICCGYVVESENEKIYYSGDTCIIPDSVLDEFFAGKIQTMYQECTFIETESTSHCSLEMLKKWIPESERRRVFCMHLGDDISNDIREAGFQIPEVV